MYVSIYFDIYELFTNIWQVKAYLTLIIKIQHYCTSLLNTREEVKEHRAIFLNRKLSIGRGKLVC